MEILDFEVKEANAISAAGGGALVNVSPLYHCISFLFEEEFFGATNAPPTVQPSVITRYLNYFLHVITL